MKTNYFCKGCENVYIYRKTMSLKNKKYKTLNFKTILRVYNLYDGLLLAN